MIQPTAPVTRIRTLLSLAGLCAACALALPAHALQTGAPPPAGPHRPPAAASLSDALALTPAQAALWQAARAATREAHAHALELRARFIRESGAAEAGGPEAASDTPRARAEREDRLHDALDKDRRAARDRWIAFEESLDPAQRKRLRAMPGAGLWPGLPPAGPMDRPDWIGGPGPGGPMPCGFAATGPIGPHHQEATDAQ